VKHLILLILSIGLALSVFFCERGFKNKNAAGLNVEEKFVEPFYYVAQIVPQTALDNDQEVQNFLLELEKQGVKQTGPLMVISYEFPDSNETDIPSFAFAARVIDSMSVSVPLTCQKWKYVNVLTFPLNGPRNSFRQIYSDLKNYIRKNNYSLSDPALERLIDVFPSLGHPADSLRMEVWVPFQKN
jgi:effector-binding domain-containing protein